MEEFVIKKGKGIDSNTLLISAVIILLPIIIKDEDLYLIMIIPILLCVFSILIELIMHFRWLMSSAIVVASDYVLFNHNLFYHNQKIRMSHLFVDKDKNTLIITDSSNLHKRQQRRFVKNKNKLTINLDSLLEKDRQELLQVIESKLS